MCVERFIYVFSVKIYRVGSGREEEVANILNILIENCIITCIFISQEVHMLNYMK